MLKKTPVLFTVLLLLTGLIFTDCAKKQDKAETLHIVIATDPTLPPMEMVDENKEIVGFDIDLMNAVAEAGGFTVEFRNTAWDGIFVGLSAGEYDAIISSVTITEERKKTFDFSDPYINAGQILVVRSKTREVEKLEDLVGKPVGVQVGTTGSFAVEKLEGVILKTYNEIGLAFEDLANGRIDCVVADAPAAADFALQNPNYKGKLKIIGEPFTEEYYGVVVLKGNTRLLEAINRGLSKILNTKTYAQIEEKWLR